MAFTEIAGNGALNGVNVVTIVAAPGSGIRRLIKNIVICNKDTADVVLTLQYTVNSVHTRIWKGTLNAGDVLTVTDMALDTTGKSITAVLAGAVATYNPEFVTLHADTDEA